MAKFESRARDSSTGLVDVFVHARACLAEARACPILDESALFLQDVSMPSGIAIHKLAG